MPKITAIVAASLLALATIPVQAGEAHRRAVDAHAAKAPIHKPAPGAHAARKHVEQQAIWPIYYYGCDDDTIPCD